VIAETIPAAEMTWPQGHPKSINHQFNETNMKTLKDLFLDELADSPGRKRAESLV
jgi:hypothetical protein